MKKIRDFRRRHRGKETEGDSSSTTGGVGETSTEGEGIGTGGLTNEGDTEVKVSTTLVKWRSCREMSERSTGERDGGEGAPSGRTSSSISSLSIKAGRNLEGVALDTAGKGVTG